MQTLIEAIRGRPADRAANGRPRQLTIINIAPSACLKLSRFGADGGMKR